MNCAYQNNNTEDSRLSAGGLSVVFRETMYNTKNSVYVEWILQYIMLLRKINVNVV